MYPWLGGVFPTFLGAGFTIIGGSIGHILMTQTYKRNGNEITLLLLVAW